MGGGFQGGVFLTTAAASAGQSGPAMARGTVPKCRPAWLPTDVHCPMPYSAANPSWCWFLQQHQCSPAISKLTMTRR